MAPPQPLAFPPTALRNVASGLVVGNPVGSSGTRAKALTSAELKAIVEASGISYLPLSGGTLTGKLTVNAGSGDLVDLQISGSSKFAVSSVGMITVPSGGGTGGIADAAGVNFRLSNFGLCLGSSQYIGLSNSNTTVPDVMLYRGASNLFEQRNGLNAQCFDIFETYTSSTNNGKLRLKATSSGHQIGSARATSGSNRAVQLGHYDAAGAFTAGLSVATSGAVTFCTLADSSAPNDSVYYSSTQSKLVYKDSGGTVNVLY